MNYAPQRLPSTPGNEDLVNALEQELLAIAQALDLPIVNSVRLEKLSELLAKPEDGDIAYYTTTASGITTEGLHCYEAGTWNKL